MGTFLASRRRLLARAGRPMTLRRPVTVSQTETVDVRGSFTNYMPDQLTAGVQQGDARVEILNDEIAAASWPGPPRARDSMTIDGQTWQIMGAIRVWEGGAVIGHSLWVRGGRA